MRSRSAGPPKARLDLAAAKAASHLIPDREWRHHDLRYVYDAAIGGKVASIGGRLLDGAARVIIGQFFAALARKAGGGAARAIRAVLAGEAASLVRRRAHEARRHSIMSAPNISMKRSTCSPAKAATHASSPAANR